MKKLLSVMLVLVMVASVVAIPAMATLSSDYTPLPYKTESFEGFRNGITAVNANGFGLSKNYAIAVKTDRLPLYGDSALIGVHKTANGASFYNDAQDAGTAAVQAQQDIAIFADTKSTLTGSNYSKKVLKLSAATENDVRGVSFGFVPNEVLSQVEGLYFKWDERAVKAADSAKAILQWVGTNGLAVGGNIAEVEHNKTLNADTATTVTVTVSDNEIVYENGDAQSIDLDLSQPPEGAVGIKLVVEYKTGSEGLETYLDNLEVGTYSNNMAAFDGDARNVDYTATSVKVKFAAAVTDYSEVKLYKDNVEVEDATYVMDADNATLTITTTEQLGKGAGYRVSTSKAATAEGAVINDVRFNTQLHATAAEIVMPNVLDMYDLNGNKLDAAFTTKQETDGTYSMDIKIFVADGETLPKAVVPSFKYEGADASKFHADFFYGYNPSYTSGQFTYELRGLYPIVNGATAIPVKNFTLLQGVNATATKHRYYNVTMSAAVIPDKVTASISVGAGQDIESVGLLAPVTVEFSHNIGDTSSFTVKEDGSDYTEYTAAWSDSNKKVVLTPNTMWTLGKAYTVSINADASIFGDKVDIEADNLTFTVTSQIPAAAKLKTFAFTDDDLVYSLDAESKTIVLINKTEDTVDFSALEYTATVDAVGATVEGATESEGTFTGTIDASGANGVSNAVEIVVDNGFDVDTTYKVYFVSTTEPQTLTTQFKLTEDFENGTVGERFTGDQAVASSGYAGVEVATVPSSNNESAHAKVQQDADGNKFLRLTAGGATTSNYVNLMSAAIPKSFYQNASKLVFRYDIRQEKEFLEGRSGAVGFSSETANLAGTGGGSRDKMALVLWHANGKYTPMRNPGDGSSYKENDGVSFFGEANMTYGTTWKTVEMEIFNREIPATDRRDPSYVGKTGTAVTLRAKEQGAATWANEATLADNATYAWNFKEQNYIRFFIGGVKGRTGAETPTPADIIGDYDNISIFAVTKDLATTVALENGDELEVGDSVTVTFKTPIKPGLEDNFSFTDFGGDTVDYTYSWSDDRLTLILTPEVEANKIYTLTAKALKDVYDNDITVKAEIPVLPDEAYAEYSETANYTVIADDHSQKLNILYKFTADGTQKVDVEFKYGSNSCAVSDVKVTKPTDGVNYATVTVDLPSQIVESGAQTVKITVVPQDFEIKILGVYFEDGLVLSDVNGVSNQTEAINALEKIAKWVGNYDEFEKLVESVLEDFADELVEKLEGAEFADLAAVKTWYNTEFANAKADNPDPDTKPSKKDDSDKGGNGSYAGGSTYTPTPSEVAPTLKQFKDLESVTWAKTAINTLYAAGIISGVSENEYAPLNNVTREEFVKLIVELFGIHDPFLKSSFDDVDPDAWYSSYIAAAERAGLISGISDSEFGIGQQITREQMATILKRACDKFGVNLSGGSTTTFIDQNTISDYAADAVKALAKAGIFSGIDGSFAPQQSANRAMAAQVIYLIYILL